MNIYFEDSESFAAKTPAIPQEERKWMIDFIYELGEGLYDRLGESVFYEADLRIIPGIEESGFIPHTNGGLRLTLSAALEADADTSHYPAIPCVRNKLKELDKEMAQDFKRVEGIADADDDGVFDFVDSWNEGCDCYADYIIEVWYNMGRVQMQAYVSLDDSTAVRHSWLGELPDFEQEAAAMVHLIMDSWEKSE